MTQNGSGAPDLREGCLGLELSAALALCRGMGQTPEIIYTGERAAEEGLTPRVIALRPGALVVALFRDGDPREEA